MATQDSRNYGDVQLTTSSPLNQLLVTTQSFNVIQGYVVCGYKEKLDSSNIKCVPNDYEYLVDPFDLVYTDCITVDEEYKTKINFLCKEPLVQISTASLVIIILFSTIFVVCVTGIIVGIIYYLIRSCCYRGSRKPDVPFSNVVF